MDDEVFYEAVALEIANHNLRPGLWAKALAEANGDETVARARYIELRAQQLIEGARTAASQEQKSGVDRAYKPTITALGRAVFILAAAVFGMLGFGCVLTGIAALTQETNVNPATWMVTFPFGAILLILAAALIKKATGTYS